MHQTTAHEHKIHSDTLNQPLSKVLSKILIVDDETDIRNFMAEYFSSKYHVLLASNGLDGLQMAETEDPSVVILDILMPGTDGISICHSLRTSQKTKHIPVIMLTALDESHQRIKAFSAGADDFLGKPFQLEELESRIESKIRRHSSIETKLSLKKLSCGNLVMNLDSLEVYVDGELISFSLLEFNLLRYLVENKGHLKSRQDILDAVWPTDESREKPTVRILDPHILSLRKNLQGFNHIVATVYGGGYIIKEAD